MSQEEQIQQLTQQLSDSQTANSNLTIENTNLKAELETLRPSQPVPEETTTEETKIEETDIDQELTHRLDELELIVGVESKEGDTPENRVKALELSIGMKTEDTPDIKGQELIYRVEAIERFIGEK